MIKIKCPECRLELEADNIIGGHRLACECGAQWRLPELPPGGNLRFCADCGRITSADACICPECSFHFLTGKRDKKTVDAIPESNFAIYRPMLIKLMLLVLLGALTWGCYAYATRSRIGVSTSSPLGKLTSKGYYNELPFRPFQGLITPDLQKDDLATLAYSATADAPPAIVIAVDKQRRVQAVSGSFTDGTNLLGFKESPSAAQNFFIRLRKELEIPAFTQFKETRRGSDQFAYTEFSAEFSHRGFRYLNRHTDRSFHSARTLAHRELYHLDKLPRERVLELSSHVPAAALILETLNDPAEPPDASNIPGR